MTTTNGEGKMTNEEALAEARGRWGARANVTYDALCSLDDLKPYQVCRPFKHFWHVFFRNGFLNSGEVVGEGDSWESAFDDAERRSQR